MQGAPDQASSSRIKKNQEIFIVHEVQAFVQPAIIFKIQTSM